MLGTQPLAGRTFTAEEDRPGGPGALVISYAFWQRDMQAASVAVGRPVTLNGVPATIVGIMPRGFGGPHSRNNNDGWLPLGPALGGSSAAGCNGSGVVHAFARVAPGPGLAAACTRLLQSWVYGVTPLDPATFAGSAAGMLVIAAAASYLPARRAARVDPLIALRAE